MLVLLICVVQVIDWCSPHTLPVYNIHNSSGHKGIEVLGVNMLDVLKSQYLVTWPA